MPHPAPEYPLEGGCTCRHVRYRLLTPPLFVHCCHCRWCQRESGAAFALNAMIEADRVELLAGAPTMVNTPSESGLGQQIARCPHCQPWVVLPPGIPAVAEYYEREGLWPAQSIARRQALMPRIQAYRAAARLDPA